MAKAIKTEILINSTPEKVWQMLTNFEHYPNWNPFIKSIHGEKTVGGKLVIEVQPANRKVMTFKPVILTFDANKELRWLGSGPVKGLFDGEHYFKIVGQENGTTKFIHGEKFSGLLVSFMPKLLKDTEVGFERMNEAIKKECEQGSS